VPGHNTADLSLASSRMGESEEEGSTKNKDPNLVERTIFISLSHIQGKAIETIEYKNCHGCGWE
jgi:hypothetical protein